MPKVVTAHTLEEAISVVQEDKEPILDVHSHAQIGDSGATELAQVLNKNSSLRTLILGSNEIGPEGAKALGAGLRPNLTLEELHLHNNKLGYEGLENLAKELAQPLTEGSSAPGNKILRVLVLRKNGIAPHCGNCALCRDSPEFPAGLFELTSLSSIDLNGNEIGLLPMGFVHLPKLIALDVRNNPLRNIPDEVFLTARKGHQSGWPGLKEYMLSQLDQEAGAGSPRVGTAAGGRRGSVSDAPPGYSGGSRRGSVGASGERRRSVVGGGPGVPPLGDPRVMDMRRGSLAR